MAQVAGVMQPAASVLGASGNPALAPQEMVDAELSSFEEEHQLEEQQVQHQCFRSPQNDPSPRKEHSK